MAKAEEIVGGVAVGLVGIYIGAKLLEGLVDLLSRPHQQAAYLQGQADERCHQQRQRAYIVRRQDGLESQIRHHQETPHISLEDLNKAVSEIRVRTALPFAPPWTDPNYDNGQYPDN